MQRIRSAAEALKLNTDKVCFTELPASVLLQTSKQTGQYDSADNRADSCCCPLLLNYSIETNLFQMVTLPFFMGDLLRQV
ncbi:hypothetical protein AWC38_SpisGene16209 [Stylophora pistillata]|uniref:Uncharacterized protein n=1 Tax=Stylophora pistillata TaxID=50429 RepID=A0A2B4RT36_STYPI|nr:hypothetical protein AWC38_SpisGene16209 [Stylophora pistillata]